MIIIDINKKLYRAIVKRKRLDNYKCCNCGYTRNKLYINRELHGHHTYNRKHHPKLQYNVNYIRTLCEKCHRDFHINWKGGYDKKCTLYDYKLWRLVKVLTGSFISVIFYKLISK